MLKNLLFILEKMNSYMPLILLPICTYKALNNIFFAGISIVMWRLMTYYKHITLNLVLHNSMVKIMILCLLLTVSILHIDIYFKTIIILLLTSIIPLYFAIDEVTIKTSKNINSFFIISGMVIAGFFISRITLLNYYFIIFTTFLFYVGKSSDFNKSKPIYSKLYIYDVLNVFIHNFHYYLFAFLIPLISYKYSGNYYMSGISCGLCWVLFLPKKYFIDHLARFLNLRKILSIGFLISAMLLVIIGFSTNIYIVCICFLFQGASAGISESFWNIDEVKNNNIGYRYLWKTGGILGALSGSLIAYYTGIKILFVLAALLALACGIMNFCISLIQKSNNGGFGIGCRTNKCDKNI